MTVGELIAQLSTQPPDTPVRVIVEDEVDSSPPADLYGWERVVTPDSVHIELFGSYA